MKTFLLSFSTFLASVCSAAEPAPKTKPLFPVVVTCFMGQIDSLSSCTSVMTKMPELDPKNRWSSEMTCGWPTHVSELRWEFIGSDGGADVYEITRRFPADAPQSETVTKKVKFEGKRIVVFEDQYQVVVLDPAKGAKK